MIAKTLYLCKDVETFGSGLRKIYALCDSANIQIGYTDSETDFTIEFSRTDRNNMSENGTINGIINDTLFMRCEVFFAMGKGEVTARRTYIRRDYLG
jgi:hypothetical protein